MKINNNKNELLDSDLKKLGQTFSPASKDFKLNLSAKLNNRAIELAKQKKKPFWNIGWVSFVVPASLLLFVMLAEAGEYAGIEIKPYQELKKSPAFQEIKKVSKSVGQEIVKVAEETSLIKKEAELPETESIIIHERLYQKPIKFEKMSDEQRNRLVTEINEMVSQEKSEPYPRMKQPDQNYEIKFEKNKEIVSSAPIYQKSDNKQIEESETTEKVPEEYIYEYRPEVEVYEYRPEQNIKQPEKISENYQTDEKNSPETVYYYYEEAKKTDYYTEPAKIYEYKAPEPSKDSAIIQPSYYNDVPSSAQPSMESDSQKPISQPSAETAPIKPIACEAKTEIIIQGKNLENLNSQAQKILAELNIQSSQNLASDKEVILQISANPDQYKKLLLFLANTNLTYSEKITLPNTGCDKISSTILIYKKSSAFDWLNF